MKTLLIFLLPAFLFASLLNIDLESKNNNLANLYIDSVDPPNDSDEVPLDNNPPTPAPLPELFDPTGMFNERGYSKSNASSIDENEIINDFSGTLMYSFPMYDIKGNGDLSINISLNYNGAMSYTVNPAPVDKFRNGDPISTQNINAPGWIVSLNGFACQTTNFETHFITPKGIGDNIENDKVKMLQVGYQIPDRKSEFAPDSKFDIINILQGDGSLLTLQNLEPNKLYGSYYSKSKKVYARAEVEFIELPQGTNGDFGRGRQIKLTRGDGLFFIFTEERTSYVDYTIEQGSLNNINRPKSLYLNSIWDRFGNHIIIQYTNVSDWGIIPGRNVLETINGSWDFTGTLIKFEYPAGGGGLAGMIKATNNSNGVYEITTTPATLIATGIHRGYVTKLKNPVGQEADFTNSAYYRNYNNVYHNVVTSKVNLIFDNDNGLRRLTNVLNYNRGRRFYTYHGNGNAAMSIDYDFKQGNYNVVRSGDTYFFGQGRDCFFNNILSNKKSYYKNETNNYKEESFGYTFTPVGTSYNDDPVDENDIYISTRTTSNNGGELYQTPNSIVSTKYYHNYPIYETDVKLEISDWPGETKMYSESVSDNVVNTTTNYEYNTDYNSQYNYYAGSFLDTRITTIIGTNQYEYNYEYVHFNNFPYSLSTNARMVPNNPIQIKREIDPYGNVTETEYLGIYKIDSRAYLNSTYTTLTPPDVKVNYYSFSQPLRVYTKNNNTVIFKQENTYNMTETNDNSYIGQILTSSAIDPGSSEALTTYYIYYIKDTLGAYVYGGIDKIPGREGSLKETIDPNGHSSMYYYHPISKDELITAGLPQEEKEGLQPDTVGTDSAPLPQISYYRYNETSIAPEIVSSLWQDRRMPTRVDNNVNPGYALKTYNLYDVSGNIIRNVENNLAVTNLSYDPIDRIGTYTLPYDFNNSASYDSVVYDTTFVPFDVAIPSMAWGYENFTLETFSLQTNGNEVNGTLFYDQSNTNYARPLIKFNSPYLRDLHTVNRARLEFFTHQYTTLLNGQVNNNLNFVIMPLSLLYKTPINTLLTEYNHSADLYLDNLSQINTLPTSNQCRWDQLSFLRRIAVTDLLRNHIINDEQELQGITMDFHRIVDDPVDIIITLK